MVLHQDATARCRDERRHDVVKLAAATHAFGSDPAQRERRLAVALGELLLSSSVVSWERTPSGSLRARTLDASSRTEHVPTIAHTRQLGAVMDGRTAAWLVLPDGSPCFAVPIASQERVVVFHFAPRPPFDGATLALVARALCPEAAPPARTQPPRSRSRRDAGVALDDGDGRYPTLAEHERAHIERTLALCGNNMVRAARALGIARSTLYERLKCYGSPLAAARSV